MVDNNFIDELFKRRAKFSKEDVKEAIEFIEADFEKKNELSETIIQSFTDKIQLAEKFYEIMPFYYDKAGVWWIWNTGKKFYELWDDIDVLNSISFSSPANTINSKERNEILQALKQVGRQHKPKDVPREWVQFSNKILNIFTGDKLEPSPEYFLTSPLPFKFGRCGETPTMDKLFEEWVGKTYVKTLYEIIAYCLYKDYPIERIFCLLGGGSNGKSCYLKLLRNFIGDENIVSTDLDLIIGSRFETAKLRNKMVCMIGETNFNDLNNTSKIKRMTSGKDPIPIEYKNKGSMDYVNYAKLIMATNNLPPTTDKTAGFGRRWCIIDFPNQFTVEKDILSAIPKEEYENLGVKCITLLNELLKNRKLTNEGSIEERQQRYEEKSNPFDKFWSENIIESSDSHIWKHDFKGALNDWLKSNSFRTMSDHTIMQHLRKRDISSQKVGADFFDDSGKKPRWMAWVGIKFKGENKEIMP